MAMFENFPYTDMHNLNLDWIIKIAKDFLDQYTHIQELISNGEESLQNITTEGLQQLQDKADNLEALLQEWYNSHSQDIANQLADALQDINQCLTNSINAFNTAAEQKAAETIASIPADYTTLSNNVEELEKTVKNISIEEGAWRYSSKVSNIYRLRSTDLIPVSSGDKILYSVGTMSIMFCYLATADAQSWTVETRTGNGEYISDENGYIAINISTNPEAEVTISDFTGYVIGPNGVIIDLHDDNTTRFVEYEQGMWRYGSKTINPARIRSTNMFPVKEGDCFIYSCGDDIVMFCYLATTDAQSWVVESVTGTGYFYAPADGFIVINIQNQTETQITVDEFTGAILLPSPMTILLEAQNNAKNSKLPNITNGKNVYVYRFGGQGNDWCFVRTPNNYNHNDKGKARPFVICNHGNGWYMDGSLQYANWTKRTMYVPLNDPDYIDDPTEYNGTSDESLWYSNPTIEALLSAGYVVCGCENYGDELYGNTNCRNACVDFFHHMINNWNVQNRCYMIGASNGALTSLNAAYLLQGRVKAMILQYPLTCLVNHYEHYQNHRAGIRAAYGISDPNISIADLTKAVATHDPLTVDVVDGQKVGTFPPVKLYYSPQDAIANCQYNTLALASMLDYSNKVVATVECSGEHGDHTHFAPADYVAWFNSN